MRGCRLRLQEDHVFRVRLWTARLTIFSVLTTALAALILVGCDDPPADGPGPVGPVGPVGPIEVEENPDAIVGSGTIASEARTAQGFERVILRGEGRVILTQSSTESLTVETDDNLLQYIEIDVRNGALEISTAEGIDIAPTASVTYRVGIVNVASIELLGAGTIEIDQLAAPEINLVLGGAGDIRVGAIEATDLSIELEGVGTIVAEGTVRHQEIKASGVGEYEAPNLSSGSATIEATGSTVVTVWVTDTLSVTTADAASVSFYGDPQLSQQPDGLGSITSLGDK